jgi:hypothetical protein
MEKLIFLIRYNLREVRSFLYFNIRILLVNHKTGGKLRYFSLRLFWY